jgi:P27 family predicted phage terminase small subunit
MAGGGRPPKPLELKRRTGNPGKRRLPAQSTTVDLVPASGAPVPISLGSHGRDLWRHANERAPWLSELDLALLETMCALRDDQALMRQRIAEEGLTILEPVVTPAGMVVGERMVAHPLLKELRVIEKQLREHASALGFDPTARARLGLAEVKRQSKIQELLGSSAKAQVIDIAPDR